MLQLALSWRLTSPVLYSNPTIPAQYLKNILVKNYENCIKIRKLKMSGAIEKSAILKYSPTCVKQAVMGYRILPNKRPGRLKSEKGGTY